MSLIGGDITSANAIITYQDNMAVRIPLPLEKFSADQSVSTDENTIAETRMGVDGKLVGGYTPTPKSLTIMFEADSLSWRIIKQSLSMAETRKTVIKCEVSVTLLSTAEVFIYKGGIVKSITDVNLKKILDPVTIKMDFERVVRTI